MKFRKLLSLLLALAMVLPCLPVMADEAAFEAAVGSRTAGFTVTESGRFEMLGAESVYMTHDKTGAEVLILKNGDKNRSMAIGFRTPLEDNMGVSHAFEHTTLSGSEKYPSKDIFMNLSNQTYNTYMNAATTDIMTYYPFASMSEQQLLKYAEFYIDSVFRPNILEDDSLFGAEVWRYSMETAEDPLDVAGTVYVEISGSDTVASRASAANNAILFPGSYMTNLLGGDPFEIPNMTREDLVAYHSRYYHPSNSMTVLYGDIEDPTPFLTLLDSYFSCYERTGSVYSAGSDQYLTESVTTTVQIPATEDTDVDTECVVFYDILLPEITAEDAAKLDLLRLTLSGNAGQLYMAMAEALPSADIGCYFDTAGACPVFTCYASGVGPEDGALLKDTVDEAFRTIAEEGFNAEGIEADAASIRMEFALISEEGEVGVSMSSSILYSWAGSDTPRSYQDYIESLDALADYGISGDAQRMVKQYLTEPALTALVTAVPVPGGIEELRADQAAALQMKKEAMSAEEIAAIVANNAALAEDMGSDEDAMKYVAALQAVDINTLPVECRSYEVRTAEGEDGIRYLDAVAGVDGIGQVSFMLNAAGLQPEDISWLKLLVDSVGDLNTEKYEVSDLYIREGRYLYDSLIRLSVFEDDTPDGFSPYLRAVWKTTEEDLAEGYQLMDEIIFHTDFTDTEHLSNVITSLKAELKSDFSTDAYYMLYIRGQCYGDPVMTFFADTSYFSYYKFLTDVETMLADDPAAVAARLTAISQQLHNRTGAVMMYAGSEEGIAAHRPVADAFLQSLDCLPIEDHVMAEAKVKKHEGIVVNSPMNYNMVYANLEQMGLEEFDAGLHVVSTILNDAYLTPQLRDRYGVYTVLHQASAAGMFILTYYDPNVEESFKVMEGVPELLRSGRLLRAVDQETLDGYKLSAFSDYNYEVGELTGAQEAMLAILSGEDPMAQQHALEQIKAVTLESIAAMADCYQAMLDNGYWGTAASSSVIKKNMKIVKSVVQPVK